MHQVDSVVVQNLERERDDVSEKDPQLVLRRLGDGNVGQVADDDVEPSPLPLVDFHQLQSIVHDYLRNRNRRERRQKSSTMNNGGKKNESTAKVIPSKK